MRRLTLSFKVELMTRSHRFYTRLLMSLVLSVVLSLGSPVVAVDSTPILPVQPQAQQAEQLFQQGMGQYRENQLEAAIATWQAALGLYQTLQNQPRELMTYIRLSAAYLQLGAPQQALAPTQAALALAQSLQEPHAEVQALGNLAIAQRGLGRYPEAIEAYKQALSILQTRPDTSARQSGQVLVNLGNVYESLGEYTAAIDAYRQSLAIAQTEENRAGEATILSNLGVVYAQIGDTDEAIRFYNQSLAITQQLDDPVGVGYALNSLGAAYHAQQDLEQATRYYERSLALSRETQNRRLEAVSLVSLGLVQEELGDYQGAITLHQQGLELAQTINDPRTQGRALNNLGHSLLSAGQLTEAETQLRESIDALESLRPGLGDTHQISLFDTHVLTYNLLQQVLVAQDKVEAALEVAERGRARAFVELVASKTNPTQLSPNNASVNSLASKAPDINQIRQIAKAQQATLVEYTLVPDDSFRFQGKQRGTAASLYIWVVQPTGEVDFRQVELKPILQETALTLTNLVQTARDRSGIRGDSDTRNWAIRPGDQVRRAGDPPEWEPYEVTAVDPQAGTVTVSHPDIFLPNPVLSINEVTKVNTSFAPTFQRGQYWQDLHQLMIAPIADLLPSDPTARVVFIPQEQLFLVPFPALQAEDGSYLIEHHTILTAPAIQIMALTAESSGQPAPPRSPAPRSLALIVGDPSPMPQTLPQLPHSATEASGIAEILSAAPLIGEVASETAVKQQLSTAPLIHLATHGFFNESNPLQ
ncbi:MAG: CHAT domain-containing tetratricopeptide repeat protein, partial [Cyanobacteria bacterium P01_G01_bin.38]